MKGKTRVRLERQAIAMAGGRGVHLCSSQQVVLDQNADRTSDFEMVALGERPMKRSRSVLKRMVVILGQ